MKITVIGLGYIGLPTAAMFASKGFSVTGVDVNPKVLEALKKGEIIIEEPGLPELVRDVVQNGKLTCADKPSESDVFIICVPTPVSADKKADMRFVAEAAQTIVPFVREGNAVILESTSPPKTVEGLMCPILEKSGLILGEELYIAHSPERVLPGSILRELENNSRVVGGINKKSAEFVRHLYRSFVKGEIFLTDATTAEMCKLMENTYRDVNIALANELAKISETLGINAWDVIELSNKHPRVNLHQPGPGVGGHCIAVDPWFIIEKAPSMASLINLSRETNDGMPGYVVSKCGKMLGGLSGRKIIVLGASYKPDVDDVRESPMKYIVGLLREAGAEVTVADPHVAKFAEAYKNLYETAKGAHLLLLGVHHKEFKELDFSLLSGVMAGKNVLDTRNFLDGRALREAGFNYVLLGAGK